MHSYTIPSGGISSPTHSGQTLNKICTLVWKIKGLPSELVGVGGPLAEVIGERTLIQQLERLVHHGRPYTVQPAPLVGLPWAGEGGSRELLAVQAIGAHLRIVLSLR